MISKDSIFAFTDKAKLCNLEYPLTYIHKNLLTMDCWYLRLLPYTLYPYTYIPLFLIYEHNKSSNRR